MARLLSLNVGMPADVTWHGRTVHTGIFKYPVDGPRMVRRLNIDGDGQGDLGGHGGEIRAVLVYQRQSYEYWREHLERADLEYGQFGENFTVDGLSDDEVHIGDRYRIGDAEFEVTQPRVTCFRVGMRLNEPRMPALLVAHHRPGFYFRVLTEGTVRAGDEILRTRIGRHQMTVAAIDALLYLPNRKTTHLRQALDIPALSPGWQASFRDLLTAAEHQTPTATPPIGLEPEPPTPRTDSLHTETSTSPPDDDGQPETTPPPTNTDLRPRTTTPPTDSDDQPETTPPPPSRGLPPRTNSSPPDSDTRAETTTSPPDSCIAPGPTTPPSNGDVELKTITPPPDSTTGLETTTRPSDTGTDNRASSAAAHSGIAGRESLMPAVPMPSGIGGQVFDTLATPGAGFGWAGFRPLRVARIVMESASVVSIHLADPDGGRLLRPEAGQYLTVRVGGAAEPAQVRNYSLSGCPSDAEYRISVKRQEHGVVSNYLHTRLRIGDLLDIAAPRGDFVLAEPASDRAPVLLISAGVGATPVLAMLHALAERGSAREIWWLHSAHSAAEHAFAAESHQLLAGLGRQHEHIFYTVPAPPNRLTAETLAALHLPTDASVYLCGPTSFMSAIRAALVAAGLDPSRIHTELFGSLPAINPGIIDTPDTAPHQPPGPTGTGPRITFTRSAITVPWSDTYPTILDLAEACDIPTRWSCRTGVCHTCRTQILSGTIRYQPDPLELPASDTTLICCAQPETDLILDL